MLTRGWIWLLEGLILSQQLSHFILTLLAMLLAVCAIIIYFSLKLKKINQELIERNKQISDINADLQKSNSELAIQKELITKKHFESDKFYEMLVQSANDSISFYDRDWKLRFTNSAFYSMLGYDRDSYNSINPPDLIHPED